MKSTFLIFLPITFIAILIHLVIDLNQYVVENFCNNLSLKGSGVLFQDTPEGYISNSHVGFDVEVDGQKFYQFEFKFKGPRKKDWIYNWSYPEETTDRQILQFGIPKSMFEPYYPVDSVLNRRELQMKQGLFFQSGRYLKPDLVRMANYYQAYLEPINALIDQSLTAEDTRRDKIEFIMKFCQDIPYGVPPKLLYNKYIGGVFPPPQVFVNKFGDCDSKAIIFCAMASYLNTADIILLYETGHVLPAVKGIPKPYDNFYTYKNESYIMADTAGPGRNAFGMVANPYQKIIEVQEVLF